MKPVLFSQGLFCCSSSLWLNRGGPAAVCQSERMCPQEVFFFFSLQDRATFRRLIVKNNAKKRRMYECFIESVPLLKSLEVSSLVIGFLDSPLAVCSRDGVRSTTEWMQHHHIST